MCAFFLQGHGTWERMLGIMGVSTILIYFDLGISVFNSDRPLGMRGVMSSFGSKLTSYSDSSGQEEQGIG